MMEPRMFEPKEAEKRSGEEQKERNEKQHTENNRTKSAFHMKMCTGMGMKPGKTEFAVRVNIYRIFCVIETLCQMVSEQK